MKKLVKAAKFSVALVFVMFLLTSCVNDMICVRGSGEVVSEIRELDAFSKIDLATTGNVFVTQGEVQSVLIETHENILSELITRVDNEGVLKIDFDKCIRNYDRLDIFITIPEISGLKISGSGEIHAENTITTQQIDLFIPGSGTIIISDIEAGSIDSRISGSGDIEISGTAMLHEIDIPGSGGMFAFDMPTNDVYIDISGSGTCRVNATNTLNIIISGSGEVLYLGDPENKSIMITGSGDVTDVNN